MPLATKSAIYDFIDRKKKYTSFLCSWSEYENSNHFPSQRSVIYYFRINIYSQVSSQVEHRANINLLMVVSCSFKGWIYWGKII